jgi:glycerol-3-phosphate acyltransferase PlsX
MIKVALDAMGGDNAPEAVVEGAVQAAREAAGRFGIVLTGPEEVIKPLLVKYEGADLGIEIFHAPDIVAMDDSPAAVLKTKPNSGLVACVALQKAGKVQASISAGNSGAMMAACLMPSLGRPTVVLDCGANVDEKAATLVHFAICGSVFAEAVLGRANPKVGLLNMGEEEKKGPETLQEAHQLLKGAPLNFIGNVEGRDLLKGEVDVIVTPGYTGNVVLKLMEGFHEYHLRVFGQIDSPEGRRFEQDWDYSNIGAALLLGLNGTGLITHGRADAKAIKNGLEAAYRQAAASVTEKITAKLAQVG